MNPLVAALRALAGKIIVPRMERQYRRFEAMLRDAPRIQRELMLQKVRRCAESQFGRDHGFRQIQSLEDFRRQIPIQPYDYYQPYIKRVTQGDVTAMFPAGERLLMYTLSSGTTADPKLIPINPTWMEEYRRGWQLWGVKAFLDHPALFYAKLNGIAGNWDMRRTPTNIPCGMASGLSARMQSPILRMMYCVPPSVYSIEDAEAKYYTALRLALPENCGLFLTATPATVVQYAKMGDRFRDLLIKDIAQGTLTESLPIPREIRTSLRRRLSTPRPERARELERVVERTGHLFPKDYWDIALVACWIGGTVGSYARHIRDYYGPAPCRDIGLLCSEGRFTIPIEDNVPAGVLEIASHFYEFVPESEIGSAQPVVLEAHELEVGKNYYILLTTSSGLYRYDIQDVLRCVDFIGQTPVLEFLNKGSRCSDMEGEKVTEHHLVEALSDAAQSLGLSVSGFTGVPVRPSAGAPYYLLLLEEQDLPSQQLSHQLTDRVDRWLCEHNVMYAGKRSDHYLDPPRVRLVPKGSFARYDQAEIARRGVGEDHYKHPCLVLDESFKDRFVPYQDVHPTAFSTEEPCPNRA